jgi:hypothetical protein
MSGKFSSTFARKENTGSIPISHRKGDSRSNLCGTSAFGLDGICNQQP